MKISSFVVGMVPFLCVVAMSFSMEKQEKPRQMIMKKTTVTETVEYVPLDGESLQHYDVGNFVGDENHGNLMIPSAYSPEYSPSAPKEEVQDCSCKSCMAASCLFCGYCMPPVAAGVGAMWATILYGNDFTGNSPAAHIAGATSAGIIATGATAIVETAVVYGYSKLRQRCKGQRTTRSSDQLY